jgi:hypothetical protein
MRGKAPTVLLREHHVWLFLLVDMMFGDLALFSVTPQKEMTQGFRD